MERDEDIAVQVTLENHTIRLSSIEKQVQQLQVISESIQNLTLSVNKLAINMENMLEEQRHQGERIRVLESEPGNNWKNTKKTFITAIVSTLAGALTVGLIVLIASFIR